MRRMVRRTWWLVVSLALALLVVACSSGKGGSSTGGGSSLKKGTVQAGQKVLGADVTLESSEESTVKAAANGKLIGIVAATMATDYHRLLNQSAQDAAKALGFDAEIFDAGTDPNKVITGIESFVSKGAVGIIVTPLGGEGVGPAAKEAVDKGIMVVEVTGRDLGTQGAITVSVEDATIAAAEGKAAGEYAASTFPGQAVQVAITDYPSIPSLVARADGIQQAMLAADPQVKVVGRFLGGTADNGLKSMETALQKHPGIQGVVGINDAGNLGAYQALRAARKTADTAFVFGIDCDPAAVKLIDQKTMYKGCVDTNPKGTGQIAVTALAKWLAGGTVPQDMEVPVTVYNGK